MATIPGLNPYLQQTLNPSLPKSDAQKAAEVYKAAGGNATTYNGILTTASLPAAKQVPTTPTNAQPAGYHGNGSFGDPANPDLSNPSKRSDYEAYMRSLQQNSEPQYDWDALYRPQFEALDAAAGTANQNALLAQQDVDLAKQGSLRNIATEEERANAVYDTNDKKIQANRDSALSEAVRYYNALSQQRNARFGRGNSAGQAVGELAQQEFFRNQGKIQQDAEMNFQAIRDSRSDLVKTVFNAKLKLDEDEQIQKNAIKRQLNEALNSINMAKGQVEADKTSRKLQVLDRAQQQMQALAMWKIQNEAAMENWKQQQDYLIQNQLVPLYNRQFNTGVNAPDGSTLSQQQQATPLTWNPKTKSFDDEFSKLNPITG